MKGVGIWKVQLMIKIFEKQYLLQKRRTHTGEKVRIKEIIAKQTTISIFIFVALFIIKIIDTPVTNYISGKVKWFLQQDISVNDIMNKVNTLIDGVINGTIWKGQLQKRKQFLRQ